MDLKVFLAGALLVASFAALVALTIAGVAFMIMHLLSGNMFLFTASTIGTAISGSSLAVFYSWITQP